MLKLFVYDHGWDGAEIIVTDSRERAVQILRDRELPIFRDLSDRHVASWPVERPNPWKRYVEEIESGLRYSGMAEYEIKDGLVIETMGES